MTLRLSRLGAFLASIAALVATAARSVAAQQPDQAFEPATQLGEQLPAAPLVFWAYALCWLILIGYIFLLWQRVSRVQRELADAARRR